MINFSKLSKMKTIIKLLFAVSVLLVSAHSANAVTFSFKYEGTKLNYETNSETTCYVSKNTDVVGNVVIPEKVVYKKKEYTVIGFVQGAFSNCKGLKSVNIGNSVTSFGMYVFYGCSNLESVTIGNSVTSIDEYTFHGFENLTSVIIGNSVKSIGDKAFADCKMLSSVVIGNSVTSIGEKAFNNCVRLTSVTIPNSVKSIGNGAFENCISLGSVIIGNSVTSIGENAFNGCFSLTSVTIPNSVTKIGDGAFNNCGLTSITLPDNIDEFGQEVFNSPVYSLIKGTTKLGDKILYNGVFYQLDEASKEAKVVGAGTTEDVVIEPMLLYKGVTYTVTTIGENAFNGVYMKSIKFPETLKTIEKEAFHNNGFNRISLPEGIEKLGYNAFARSEYLESIHLPSTLKDVSEDFIFGGCYNLKTIEFDSQATVDRLGKDINNLTRGAHLAKVVVKGKKAETLSEASTPEKGHFYWKTNTQGKKYLVNEAGKTILPANAWDKVWFEVGIILVQKGGKYGCYSYYGTRLVAPLYEEYIGSSGTDKNRRLLFGNNTATGGKYFVFSSTGQLLASQAFSRSQSYRMAAWMKDWVPALITWK